MANRNIEDCHVHVSSGYFLLEITNAPTVVNSRLICRKVRWNRKPCQTKKNVTQSAPTLCMVTCFVLGRVEIVFPNMGQIIDYICADLENTEGKD
jgi:hypothetical protein